MNLYLTSIFFLGIIKNVLQMTRNWVCDAWERTNYDVDDIKLLYLEMFLIT